MPTITLLYAGILGIISIILAAGVDRSRIAHPIGLRADAMSHPLRVIGAIGTIGVMLVMSIWAIVLFF